MTPPGVTWPKAGGLGTMESAAGAGLRWTTAGTRRWPNGMNLPAPPALASGCSQVRRRTRYNDAMANRYLLPALPGPGRAVLTGDLAHHLGRVLRVRPGERLQLGDGRGGTAAATVLSCDRGAIAVDVGEVRQLPPMRPRLLLAFAVPRAARAEWLFEHATEVGVAAFQPLWTARTRPQGERSERWQRLVQAACGQCDRAWIPTVLAPVELTAWLAQSSLPPRRIVGASDGPPLSPTDADDEMAMLVGPEGGFATEEASAAAAAGFVPRRFGPHILRTETAAVVGAGLLLARGQ